MKRGRSGAKACMNIREQKMPGQKKVVLFPQESSFTPVNGKPPDYRSYKLSLKEGAAVIGIGTVVILCLAWLFYRSMIFGLFLSPALVVFWKWEQRRRQNLRKKMLRRQFSDGIQSLAASLRAGYSVENGLSLAERELRKVHGEKSILAEEFMRIRHQIQMNRTVEAGFLNLAERSDIPEIREMAGILAIAKRSGGRLTEILHNTAGVLEAKGQLEDEIAALTAAKRMEQRIMCLMPAGILFYVGVTSPEFLEPLYVGLRGRVIMTVCLAVYGCAAVIGEKIMRKMVV